MFSKYLKLFSLLIIAIIYLSACSEDCPTNNNDSSLEWNKKITKIAVHNHAIMLGELLKDIDDLTERKALIRKSIDSVIFFSDSSGYFYVYDYNCVNIAHAKLKNLLDQNLYDYQDTKGKYVIRELSAMAQQGGGYVEFYWQKPGNEGEKKKMGYVEPIPNTDYFIGSGVYLE